VEIVLSDTGQGVAPELLPYVFEHFRQADSSSTREHAGLACPDQAPGRAARRQRHRAQA
jgi:signal transduction histidine kinase